MSLSAVHSASAGVCASARRDAALAPWLLAGALLGCGVLLAATGIGSTRVWVLLLLAPVLEEAVFRAGLQDALVRTRLVARPLTAALWTALAFALVHVWARQDAAALWLVVPGLGIGLVYLRWQRLRWCVLLHAGMNALWLGIAPWATRAIT